MSVQGAVRRGRRAAERLMLDECTITRPGVGDPTWNEGTDQYDAPAAVTVYSGKCRVKAETAVVREVDAGEREIGVVRWTVSVPVVDDVYDTAAIGRGHTVTVTASALDAGLVGREFVVSAGFVGSQNTARRLPVEAVTP